MFLLMFVPACSYLLAGLHGMRSGELPFFKRFRNTQTTESRTHRGGVSCLEHLIST